MTNLITLDQEIIDLCTGNNGCVLAGNEITFSTILAKKPKLIGLTTEAKTLHVAGQDGQLVEGDRIISTMTADQAVCTRNSEESVPTMTLKAGFPSKFWMPELTLLLRNNDVIHLI